MKKEKKTLIFDFDGTLVDSMKQYAAAMINLLDKNNISYPDDIMKIITPLGYEGTARYFADVLGLDMPIESMMADMRAYAMNEYTNNILLKETVFDTLKTLKAEGYSLNVLTASPHVTLDVCLMRNGIYDIFDNVWSCDDFNTTKADVNIYLRAAERLGKSPEDCIFLDDNINADITAKRAGMTVIGVYDGSSAEYEEQIKAETDGYIYKMDELLELRKI